MSPEREAAAAVERPIERTSCSCPDCIRCCHDQPGSLAEGDLERIAAHLQLPVRVAALKFWASRGARIANRATGQQLQVGTITPRRVRGRCIFLTADERCAVHTVAPAGCAYFDTHMDRAEGQRRGVWLVRQQMSAAYQSIRRTLSPASSYQPRSY